MWSPQLLFCSVPDSRHLSTVTVHPKMTPLTVLTWTRTLRNTALNTLSDMVPGRGAQNTALLHRILSLLYPQAQFLQMPREARLCTLGLFLWGGQGEEHCIF